MPESSVNSRIVCEQIATCLSELRLHAAAWTTRLPAIVADLNDTYREQDNEDGAASHSADRERP